MSGEDCFLIFKVKVTVRTDIIIIVSLMMLYRKPECLPECLVKRLDCYVQSQGDS